MATPKRAHKRRKYTQQRRAEQQSETRRRIVEAVYALHGELGPARTTIKAIAERAGVERLTVYRHFADEGEIFAACNAHFAFYGYYWRVEAWIGKALRDAEELPALAALMAPWGRFVEAVGDDLQEAWAPGDGARPRLAAVIGHALRFDTWRSLAHVEGLDDATAADLMVALARAAAPGAKAD
jgi:AcrR family transcriptional regulator